MLQAQDFPLVRLDKLDDANLMFARLNGCLSEVLYRPPMLGEFWLVEKPDAYCVLFRPLGFPFGDDFKRRLNHQLIAEFKLRNPEGYYEWRRTRYVR